jgi:hypothetical protein
VIEHTQDDYQSVIDGLQEVTLVRRPNDDELTLSARRLERSTWRPYQADPAVQATDTVWDAPWPEEEAAPALGDVIQSDDAADAVLLSVERRGPGRRYRCRVRALALDPAATVLVDLQQSVWEDLGSGLELTGWTTLVAEAPASIRPRAVELDHEAVPIAAARSYRLTLGSSASLEQAQRIVGPGDEVYRVDRVVELARLDRLPAVEATLVEGS